MINFNQDGRSAWIEACGLWHSLQQNKPILRQQKTEAKQGLACGIGYNNNSLAFFTYNSKHMLVVRKM
jgi:hypothetical protein